MAKSNFIYGLHPIQSLLRQHADRVLELFVQSGRRDDSVNQIIKLAFEQGIAVHEIDRKQLDKKVGGVVHQGVVACVRSTDALNENDLWTLLDGLKKPPFLLILDQVQDPHNLGACLRSADAFGVDAVIAPKDHSVDLTPSARKVACGAAETVPFIPVTNLARTMRELKERNIWLIGTADDAEQNLYDTNLSGATAIVMGTEGKGLRRLTKENCDLLVKIPMCGSVESLNVSVATGIFLYAAARGR